ncbi:hypothetical protein N0V93_001581 [Gnomoniopsis smithogilvyi]|uniref:Tyrosinase copper-binding domain-containing protein n=1 Tax=Gnomoniopsis smithogilvyi TaxID=1191159 RepID=A0A9W9D2U7_9PEZI|nr:hypothetical protein N0V93_001581 [Gnomoniopsis smithogilvyi]
MISKAVLQLVFSIQNHAAICQSPRIRKEWRNLSQTAQLDYITAIKCMISKPAQTSDIHQGAKSRFDDFQALHIDQTDYIHWCGQFLPWHRYFLSIWQDSLTQECGYTGSIPYWNWALDATEESMPKSPLFDTIYGFGGNGPYIANVSGFPSDWQSKLIVPGRTGGGCVSDGPFSNLTVNMGPGNHTDYSPHCLRRDFSPSVFSSAANQTVLDMTYTAENFWYLDTYIEGNISTGIPGITTHGGGHLGVGGQIGEMTNMYSSPGDPLFYLHHGGIDWLWWTWQRSDWPARKASIGGPDTEWAYPYDYYGDISYQNITLQTPLHYGEIADSIVVGDVMDTEGGLLCYTYE